MTESQRHPPVDNNTGKGSLDQNDELRKLVQEIVQKNISGSRGNQGAAASDSDHTSFALSEDVYSILAVAKFMSVPFWFSIVVIFGFQYLLLSLLLVNQLDLGDMENPLNLGKPIESSG